MDFVAVADLADVPPGTMRLVDVHGRGVVLVNRDGEIYALENRCPHQGGPLGKGRLEGDALVCPWHGWRWDPRTGRARWPSVDWRVAHYPVRIAGGQVMVRVP